MTIVKVPTNSLKANHRNARTHSSKQIGQIAESIQTFGFVVPIVIDSDRTVLAGHGRLAAAKKIGLSEVPVIEIGAMTEMEKRAFMLADNKIAQNAGWDRQKLAVELPELADLLCSAEMDISITGFAPAEIEELVIDFEADNRDPADEIDQRSLEQPVVSKPGDLWLLGNHRLLCGDARDPAAIQTLLGNERARMAFLDVPYNVRIADTVGRGSVKHEEFAMASGELSRSDFVDFLKASLKCAASASVDGAVHFVCIDWRHVAEVIEAGSAVYGDFLNIVAWVKSNFGCGAFYRSQHELICVFRTGTAAHLNNIDRGKHGRTRSNVWNYAGANTFRAGRMNDLKSHPTVKPIALVADATKDCTALGDIVLDTFSGSGTTILAAERVGRRGYAIEIEPRFVDVAIRRWQAFTKKDAVHFETGRCFDDFTDGDTATPMKLAA